MTCSNGGCDLPHNGTQFCGVTMDVGEMTEMGPKPKYHLIPCQSECFHDNMSTLAIDIMCPTRFKFAALAERSTVFNKNSVAHNSTCIVCEQKNGRHKVMVSICSPHNGKNVAGIMRIRHHNIAMCDADDEFHCDEREIPRIDPSQHCGFKNERPWPKQHLKRIKYLPCQKVRKQRLNFICIDR
jgi:hypothetical protein